jgi:hypothetical protein
VENNKSIPRIRQEAGRQLKLDKVLISNNNVF